MRTTIHPTREELMSWLDGEADASSGALLAQHVEACPSCAAVVSESRATTATLAGWTVDAPPAALTERVSAFARRNPVGQTNTSPWRSARWRWAAIAALVVIGVFVPLRMQCVEASSMCRLDGVRHLFSGAPAAAPVAVAADAAHAAAQTPDGLRTVWEAVPRLQMNVPAENAKVVVVVFGDWQCPSCRALHQAYGPVFDDYAREHPGEVRLVMKDFPLNSACNASVSTAMHASACDAAVAVRLAREHGKDAGMIDWIFANQETLSRESIRTVLSSLTGVEEFDARYEEQIERVRAESAEGGALGINSTPTCYINGVKSNTADGRWVPVPVFRQFIEFERTKGGGPR